ncbi:RES family NAD+ phosphorylase [uncultured Rhodospira sp.]|uniref:RES family NAD+ phosphorylase n=1 Tax=uncultured Rhodospira sp. TaxID=1936189 RepID=UPI002609B131|nr:RES family NAD+ phosphorylase [uncultured Rhodospira sp.]
MVGGRTSRDLALLDALDALEWVPFEGRVWRAVREGRDPLQGHPSAGRWDPGTFDVLYTSLEPEGAVAEMRFHLARQPVFPSHLTFVLHEMSVRTARTLRFADLSALAPLGVDTARYADVLYEATQAIGDAADFLGFDGILAPGARWPCLNLVIFTDRVTPQDLDILSSTDIDWPDWDARLRSS